MGLQKYDMMLWACRGMDLLECDCTKFWWIYKYELHYWGYGFI